MRAQPYLAVGRANGSGCSREDSSVRQLLKLHDPDELQETFPGPEDSCKLGRRIQMAGCLWFLVLAAVGCRLSWTRQQLDRFGAAPIGEAEETHFMRVKEGSCASEGLHPLLDSHTCTAAAAQLGLRTTKGSHISMTNLVNRPEGCYYFINSSDKTSTLWLGTSPDSIGRGTETGNKKLGWLRQPICRIPHHRVTTAAPRAEKKSKPKEPEEFCCYSGRTAAKTCSTCRARAKASTDCATENGCITCGGTWCRGDKELDAPKQKPFKGPEERAPKTTRSTEPSTSATTTKPPQPQPAANSKPTFTVLDFKHRMGATATPQDAFMWLDKNSDGFVGWDSFKSGTLAFVPPLTEDEARQAFHGFDKNGDTHVTSEEFFECLDAGRFMGDTSAAASTTAESASQGSEAGKKATTSTHAPMASKSASKAQGRDTVGAETLGEGLGASGLAANAGAAPGVMSDTPAMNKPPMKLQDFLGTLKTTYRSPEEAFSAFDLDGSGCLDRTEFVSASSVLEKPISRYEASNLFAGFDDDNDQEVCRKDFFATLKNGHFPREEAMEGSMTVKLFKERIGKGIAAEFAFASLDKNADGSVGLHELMDGRGAFRPPLTEDEVRSAFAGFDADQSSHIEHDEFFSAMAAGHFLPPSPAKLTPMMLKDRLGSARPHAAFEALDRDGDSLVSFMEFVGSRGAFNPPLSDVDAQRVFRGLDRNEDRHVSFREFNTVLCTGRFFHDASLQKGEGDRWTPEDPPGGTSPPMMAGMPELS